MQQLPRLDKLPFARWHLMLVVVLGVSWIFDGYEVSSLSLCSTSIKQSLNIENSEYYLISSFYMVGCALGGLTFGVLSFFIGRKNIFITTLLIYAASIILILVSSNLPLVILSRFVAGISIGGQYTAIFAAIDQFIPATYRGRVDIIIDGSWHLGGVAASLLSMSLNGVGTWKWMFGIGMIGILPLVVLRRYIPESPRWLCTKNRDQEAVSIITMIERAVGQGKYVIDRRIEPGSVRLINQENRNVTCTDLLYSFLRTVRKYPRRVVVSAVLIFCQAFFFNSMYYRYPIILASLGVQQDQVGSYMIQLSIVSFLGPVLIGQFFDTIGRRIMCLLTYCTSGILIIVLSFLNPSLTSLQIFMVILFLISSPAASSANLTASELFPTESRCLILSVVFVIGMLGGIVGVWVESLLVAGILMAIAGVIGWLWGVDAEGRSLEELQQQR